MATRLADDERLLLKRARRPSPRTAALLDAEAAVLARLPPGRVVLPIGLVARRGSDDRALLTGFEPGGSLAGVVRPLPPAAVTGLVVDLARALGSVHVAGWVHGRVTAEHVLVGRDGRVVLGGFGRARRLAPGPDGTTAAADDLAQLAAVARLLLDPTATHEGLTSVLDRLAHPDPLRRPDPGEAIDLLARFGPVPAPVAPPLRDGGRPERRSDSPARHGTRPDHAPRTGWTGPARTSRSPIPGRDDTLVEEDHGPGGGQPAGSATTQRGAPAPVGRRPLVPVLAGLAGVGLVVAGARQLTAPADGGDPTQPAAAGVRIEASAVAAAPRPCPDVGHPAPAPDETTAQVDPDGRGCTVPVLWSPVRAEVTVATPEGVRRYRLGEPGDRVVLGDWDCDGDATPLVVRSDPPAAYRFDAWPEADRPVTPVAVPPPAGTTDGSDPAPAPPDCAGGG